MDMNEIDLEFIEHESEERLTRYEAVLLGLPSGLDAPDRDTAYFV